MEGAVMPALNGKFVLRRIEENDPRFHRVYMVRKKASQITSADNVFDGAPDRVSKAMYQATRIDPPEPWDVKLKNIEEPVLMGVFRLESIQ
jgi:hypothetical protein